MTAGIDASDLAQRQRAQAKLAILEIDVIAARLRKASQKAKTVAQRVNWFQRAASAWAMPMKEVSAYEHRPMACSTLLNLDEDDLLCRHAEEAKAELPNAGARKLKLFALSPISAAPFLRGKCLAPA